ncbi:DUF599 domain-containing protein [Benzoatithermus flavus]|uniref:DUF599 family protein n=1 Tax=Benzoatithermus flavus TaxID=3108223 RepID=A0ABU8XLQ9_9PROT
MQELLATIGWADLLAPIFFVLCWAGYAAVADGTPGSRSSLMSRMHEYRRLWMRRMLTRENRIPDLQVLLVLTQSNAFFASSAVLIVGGCLAILGAREQAMQVLADFPFVAHTPLVVWELKVLLLVVVFVYAFFKFTWSLRQFNYVAILIGGAPPPARAASTESLTYAESAAAVASRAAEHFNKAMRTFYFGLAALSWFLQPFLFMVLTALVVLVAYRREFKSHTLTAVGRVGEAVPGAPELSPRP